MRLNKATCSAPPASDRPEACREAAPSAAQPGAPRLESRSLESDSKDLLTANDGGQTDTVAGRRQRSALGVEKDLADCRSAILKHLSRHAPPQNRHRVRHRHARAGDDRHRSRGAEQFLSKAVLALVVGARSTGQENRDRRAADRLDTPHVARKKPCASQRTAGLAH